MELIENMKTNLKTNCKKILQKSSKNKKTYSHKNNEVETTQDFSKNLEPLNTCDDDDDRQSKLESTTQNDISKAVNEVLKGHNWKSFAIPAITASMGSCEGMLRRRNHIKRPMNAFMVWAQAARKQLSDQYPHLHNADLSKTLGKVWRLLDDKGKQPFIEEAAKIKNLHREAHPEYKYQPRRKCKVPTNPVAPLCNTSKNTVCKTKDQMSNSSVDSFVCEDFSCKKILTKSSYFEENGNLKKLKEPSFSWNSCLNKAEGKNKPKNVELKSSNYKINNDFARELQQSYYENDSNILTSNSLVGYDKNAFSKIGQNFPSNTANYSLESYPSELAPNVSDDSETNRNVIETSAFNKNKRIRGSDTKSNLIENPFLIPNSSHYYYNNFNINAYISHENHLNNYYCLPNSNAHKYVNDPSSYYDYYKQRFNDNFNYNVESACDFSSNSKIPNQPVVHRHSSNLVNCFSYDPNMKLKLSEATKSVLKLNHNIPSEDQNSNSNHADFNNNNLLPPKEFNWNIDNGPSNPHYLPFLNGNTDNSISGCCFVNQDQL